MPAVSATWEAEIRESLFETSLGNIVKTFKKEKKKAKVKEPLVLECYLSGVTGCNTDPRLNQSSHQQSV